MEHFWIAVDEEYDAFDCSDCPAMVQRPTNYCPRCGVKMDGIELCDGTEVSMEMYRFYKAVG